MRHRSTVAFIRGINYDTGTRYQGPESALSRPGWNRGGVERDLQTIRDDLRCSAVCVFGTEPARLVETASMAASLGLEVTLQPRFVDVAHETTLSLLAEVAGDAEKLRRSHPNVMVSFNVGCELTIFSQGIIPGGSHHERMQSLLSDLSLMAEYSSLLNTRLDDYRRQARERFQGPLLYSAGLWETVDWSGFDYIGLNYYRADWNAAYYVANLRQLVSTDKPTIITEFGCCTYKGAADKGGGGNVAADWSKSPPEIHPGFERSEAEQAQYIRELLQIFLNEGISGAYAFEFIEPAYPHREDSRHDMDIASFGIVKAASEPAESDAEMLRWEPKQAYFELSSIYKQISDDVAIGQTRGACGR